MTISTLRQLLFGTLALATLLSVMLVGGSNDASAVSIHKPNLQATAVVYDHFNPNSVDCNSTEFAINITIRTVDTIKTASPSKVRLVDNTQGTSSANVPSIPPSGSVVVSMTVPSCEGLGMIPADATFVVSESNESDNQLLFSQHI